MSHRLLQDYAVIWYIFCQIWTYLYIMCYVCSMKFGRSFKLLEWKCKSLARMLWKQLFYLIKFDEFPYQLEALLCSWISKLDWDWLSFLFFPSLSHGHCLNASAIQFFKWKCYVVCSIILLFQHNAGGCLTSSELDLRISVHYGVPSTASILAVDPIQRLLAIGTL